MLWKSAYFTTYYKFLCTFNMATLHTYFNYLILFWDRTSHARECSIANISAHFPKFRV